MSTRQTKQAWSCISYVRRTVAYGLRDPFIGRHALVYRFFTSGANTSLAFIDEFESRSRSQPSSCW